MQTEPDGRVKMLDDTDVAEAVSHDLLIPNYALESSGLGLFFENTLFTLRRLQLPGLAPVLA